MYVEARQSDCIQTEINKLRLNVAPQKGFYIQINENTTIYAITLNTVDLKKAS